MFDTEPALENVYDALNALNPEDAKRVLEGYRANNPSGFPSSESHRYNLWRILLGGIILIAAGGVIAGTILTINGVDSTAAWVLATAATTGILALFAKSPSETTS